MKERIIAALRELDPLDDNNFTNAGLPKVDVVEKIVGEHVTRTQITEAAPQYTQENPELPEDEGTEEDTSTPTTEVQEEVSSEVRGMDFDPLAVPSPDNLVADHLKGRGKEDMEKVVSDLEKEHQKLIDARKVINQKIERLDKVKSVTYAYRDSLYPPETFEVYNTRALNQGIKRNHLKAQATQEALGGVSLAQIQALDPRSQIDKAYSASSATNARPGVPQPV